MDIIFTRVKTIYNQYYYNVCLNVNVLKVTNKSLAVINPPILRCFFIFLFLSAVSSNSFKTLTIYCLDILNE